MRDALIACKDRDSTKLSPRRSQFGVCLPCRGSSSSFYVVIMVRTRLNLSQAQALGGRRRERAPPPRRPKTVADKQPKEDDGLDPKRVYVSRLPKAWTDDVLAEKCAPFGTVARASVMLDATTNASRGFGFVVFDDETGKAALWRRSTSKAGYRTGRATPARCRT